ncbi:MAG: hypothetical protein WKF79_01600 [Nocardioides sp.]
MAEAEKLGLSYSEYIAYVLANAHDVPTPLPPGRRDRDQRELPLQSAS